MWQFWQVVVFGSAAKSEGLAGFCDIVAFPLVSKLRPYNYCIRLYAKSVEVVALLWRAKYELAQTRPVDVFAVLSVTVGLMWRNRAISCNQSFQIV